MKMETNGVLGSQSDVPGTSFVTPMHEGNLDYLAETEKHGVYK